MTAILRSRRRRWFGHVKRGTSCIKRITDFTSPDSRGRGRPGKTWAECARNDVDDLHLSAVNPLDRAACLAWRSVVRRSLVQPTPQWQKLDNLADCTLIKIIWLWWWWRLLTYLVLYKSFLLLATLLFESKTLMYIYMKLVNVLLFRFLPCRTYIYFCH